MAKSMRLLLYMLIILSFWLIWQLVQVALRLSSSTNEEEQPNKANFFHNRAPTGEKDITDKAKIIEDNPSSDR